MKHHLFNIHEIDRTADCEAHGRRVDIIVMRAGCWHCGPHKREMGARYAATAKGKTSHRERNARYDVTDKGQVTQYRHAQKRIVHNAQLKERMVV
jgi:hypothetical protein